MHAYKTFIPAVIALFGIPALAWSDFWEECSPVSYDAFQQTKSLEEGTFVGPRGRYAMNINGDCIYLDASSSSDFAKNHAAEHSSFVAGVKSVELAAQAKGQTFPSDLEFLTVKQEVRTTPNIASRGSVLRQRQKKCGTSCGINVKAGGCKKGCPCSLGYVSCYISGECDYFYFCEG